MSEYLVRIFQQILESSTQAGVAILVVILVGGILRLLRAPKQYGYLLWMIPFLRLLLPVTPKRPFAMFPGEKQIVSKLEPLLAQPVKYIDGTLNPEIVSQVGGVSGPTVTQTVGVMADAMSGSSNWWDSLSLIFAVVWLMGILVILGYSLWSVVRLEKRLSMNFPVGDRIYMVDGIPSAFVMGLFQARIYLPSEVSPEKLPYVLSHEQEHIRRKDHIVKPVVFVLCSIYWFQPLVWLAYYFLCQDMELACDEGVIRRKKTDYRKQYAAALLELSVNQGMGPVPLAFSEGSPKKRIQNIMTYKKSGMIAVGISVVFIGLVALLALTAPKPDQEKQGDSTLSGKQEQMAENVAMEEFLSGLKTGHQLPTNEISVTVPVVDLEAPTGADGVELYYGDREKLIFGDYFGLFVYSMEEKEIVRALDRAAIECQYTQGDMYCDIRVAADGNTVYLHPMHLEDMYVYHVEENTLFREPYDLTGVELYSGIQEQGYVIYQENSRERVISIARAMGSIGDVGYYVDSTFFHPLFREELYKDAVYFEPEDLHDLVKIEMQMGDKVYSTDSNKALKYIEKYLGSCKKDIGISKCPFYDPMYLTREDGVVGIIYPAMDSCSTFCSGNGNCYDYTPGYADNEEFWDLIGNWHMAMGE